MAEKLEVAIEVDLSLPKKPPTDPKAYDLSKNWVSISTPTKELPELYMSHEVQQNAERAYFSMSYPFDELPGGNAKSVIRIATGICGESLSANTIITFKGITKDRAIVQLQHVTRNVQPDANTTFTMSAIKGQTVKTFNHLKGFGDEKSPPGPDRHLHFEMENLLTGSPRLVISMRSAPF